MKRIKLLILISFFIIIILISCIIIVNKGKQDNIISKDQKDNENYITVPPGKSTEVGYQEFYTVSSCVGKYIDSINKNNNIYYSNNEMEFNNEMFKERIKALLSEKFNGNISIKDEKYNFTAINVIKSFSNKNVDTYVVHGFISNVNMESFEDLYCVVNLDTKNYTFSIEPLNSRYNTIEEIEPEKIDNISKNEYNMFSYEPLSDEKKCTLYFNYIRRLMLVNPELAYTYIDEEYKSIRFKNYDNFVKYIQNNRNIILESVVKNYKINGEGTEIYILDQYSNIFKFNIEGIMKFKVQLDDYIVMLDEEIEKYNALSVQQKIVNCINRWIKMINSKDYEFAYNYLDKTFSENNFKGVENFEKYVKQKWPEFIDIKCSDYKEVNDVGTMKVKISARGTSNTENNKVIEKTFIVKLLDDNNFVMSFNVNE